MKSSCVHASGILTNPVTAAYLASFLGRDEHPRENIPTSFLKLNNDWECDSGVLWRSQWQDYYGYQRKQPFVFAHLVGLILSLVPGSLATVKHGANR